MPKFTETHGTTVVTKLQLPTSGKKCLHFHEEQKAQDRTGRPTVTSSDAKVVGSVLTALYDGPKGIWTVDLTAAKDGTATVTGKRKDGQAAEIGVTVAAPPPQMKLPAENTQEGLVTRLLLSETQTPSNLTYKDADAQKAMEWMHLVLYNRLKDPTRFGAKKNAGIVDLIKAKGQFAGFENYPKIAAGVQARIADILKRANNINDTKQSEFRQHVQHALDTAALKAPISDPSPNGLIGWRTANHGSPGEEFIAYETPLAGNQFYEWKTMP
jgi:hypothetical protein